MVELLLDGEVGVKLWRELDEVLPCKRGVDDRRSGFKGLEAEIFLEDDGCAVILWDGVPCLCMVGDVFKDRTGDDCGNGAAAAASKRSLFG